MYRQLSDNKTKLHYKEILNETLLIAEEHLSLEQTTLWNSIVNQLRDIKEKVVEKQTFTGWEEIYDRYTLGAIAVRDFSDNDEMQDRLCDIYSGAIDYSSMPKE